MTQSYFPFATGAGANAGQDQWQDMARNWLDTGVMLGELNELVVYADATGLRVKVKTGYAWIRGFFFKSTEEETLAIATANATNPRIDRVVIRVDWIKNEIKLAVIQGVASTTPTPPPLTQNTATWEIALAQVRVDAAAVSIASNKVTDERTYAQGSVFVSRSRNNFLGDANHQAYGSADTRVTFPRVDVHRGGIEMQNTDGTFKVTTAGLYAIVVSGQAQRVNDTLSYQPILKKNNNFYRALGNYRLSSVHDSFFYAIEFAQLVPNDIIELWVHLQQTNTDYFFPYFQIQIVKIR